MQSIDGRLVYSATDLVGFLECRHLASLERAAVEGFVSKPVRVDPMLDRLAQRGVEHEARFLRELAPNLEVARIPEPDRDAPRPAPGERGAALERRRDETREAMRRGADVIYQAVLFDGRRLGFADFLVRIEVPSDLGTWSYEVWDTKLARKAKASAVLQICMYSEMVGAMQGHEPESMHLALGGIKHETVSFRVADYAAYYRMVARDFEAMLGGGAPSFPVLTEPEPVEHCGMCTWSETCRGQWRAQDDLSLVAGLTSRQRRGLRAIEVATRTGLGDPAAPLPDRIDGIGRDALARVQAQAAIQVRGEREHAYLSEHVAPERTREGDLVADRGLLMLPPPSPGDLFFDMEGDPFFGSEEVDGIDYLFGVIEPGRTAPDGQPAFHALWSIEETAEGPTVTPAGEQRAFEAFIDLVMDRLAADPQLHVYHYAPYETTAVKRLSGRYGTREDEVTRLLRAGVFVDLYRAVRQGIRASVESYSIKKLEPLYDFHRTVDLRDAGSSIVEFETWLELGHHTDRTAATAVLDEIAGYNRDDCVSTLRLRDWLEVQRAALEATLGEPLPRPAPVETEAVEDSEAQQQVRALMDALLDGLPEQMETACIEERGRWLLAQLLWWYRREERSFWWRYFELLNEYTDEQRIDERDALGGLVFLDSRVDPTPRTRSTIYRFRFPPQEHRLRAGNTPRDQFGQPVGTIFAIDEDERTIELRLGTNRPAPQPTSLIPYDLVRASPKPESLQALATWVLANGIDAPGPFRAARDLLLRRPPRVGQPTGAALFEAGEDVQDVARSLVMKLDESYLAIQGPPGSGKSTVGAQMIVDVVQAGKRVGVTAASHKVIGELLSKVAEIATARGVHVRIGQRTSGDEPATCDAATPYADAAGARDAILGGELDVLGATAWQWARTDMQASVDVLFIDEAGQFALADAIAVALGASNLVLLGDPQQLEQVVQGTHPPGVARPALGHVIDGARVMPAEYGLFLDGTWRLHPDITAFTSEVFYESRLRSHPGREVLDLLGIDPLHGVGIRFVAAEHAGHSSESPPEAAAIAAQVRAFLDARPTWVDAKGETREVTEDDVLVITPYNAQVAAILRELPGVRVGTVDKFQGQEAPVAIYSMATSSAEEAPRGLEFLYNLNRLNVATSRAQCLAIVVANPALLRARCTTPRQMRLVNALARLVEFADAREQ